MTEQSFTVRALAARWAVPAEKVRDLIASGQLSALDVSLHPGQGKARWRILADAVERFERSRSTVQPATQKRTRKRSSKSAKVIEFF